MKKMNTTNKEGRCTCPYCEEEMADISSPLCQACGIVVRHCLKCQITVLDREATNCPECGEPLS